MTISNYTLTYFEFSATSDIFAQTGLLYMLRSLKENNILNLVHLDIDIPIYIFNYFFYI